jgi:anti-repressor protein
VKLKREEDVMNEIKLFENTKVEIITDNNGEPLFELYSTGMALGQVKKNSKGIEYPRKDRIDENVKNAEIKPCVHNGHKYISESQLYDFMLEAKTDKVKPFRKWLVNEVLPSIRKTGGYSIQQKQDSYMIENPADRARRWAEEYEEKLTLQTQLIEQKPLVEFADHVSNASNLIDIGRLAKLVNDEHIPIGRNKLFEWLRNNKYLRNNNEPYQQYVDNGVFKVKEYTYTTPYGDKVGTKVYVTGKGQIYIVEKLRKLYAA